MAKPMEKTLPRYEVAWRCFGLKAVIVRAAPWTTTPSPKSIKLEPKWSLGSNLGLRTLRATVQAKAQIVEHPSV